MSSVLLSETIPGGWTWSHVLKRGQALRVTDPQGGACAALALFNPVDTSERYNLPDTLKAQLTAKLTRGHALYSDMGRVLLSVLEDEVGWHDPLGGWADDALVEARYGLTSYQDQGNAYTRSAHRALLAELGRHELGRRDLTAVINLFCRVRVGPEGDLAWQPQDSAGRSVLLQAEMDTLVVLAATQHRLDPRPAWAPREVRLSVEATAVPPEANPAWWHSDQNKRGFHNTLAYVR